MFNLIITLHCCFVVNLIQKNVKHAAVIIVIISTLISIVKSFMMEDFQLYVCR